MAIVRLLTGVLSDGKDDDRRPVPPSRNLKNALVPNPSFQSKPGCCQRNTSRHTWTPAMAKMTAGRRRRWATAENTRMARYGAIGTRKRAPGDHPPRHPCALRTGIVVTPT